MNKFITRVAKLVLGLSLAAGVGVAVGSKKASRVEATDAAITSFSATSGSLDSNISYTSGKGDGTTAAAISGTSLRIYKPASGKSTGGFITVSAASGYLMTSCTFTLASDKNGTIKSEIDGGSLSGAISVSSGGTTSNLISGTASTVTIYNCGSDRLSFSGISVSYQSGSVQTYSIIYDDNVSDYRIPLIFFRYCVFDVFVY